LIRVFISTQEENKEEEFFLISNLKLTPDQDRILTHIEAPQIIKYQLQMASSTSYVVHKSGVSMMVAQGSIYHLLNPIETSRDPQYVQLYIYCATNDLGLLAVSQLEVM